MKKTTILLTICGVTAVGVAGLYLVKKKLDEQNKNECKETSDDSREDVQVNSIDDYSFGQEKEQASKSIYERHQEAANLIKETLQEAEDNTNESEHKVDFDEIDVNLDKLLEEE